MAIELVKYLQETGVKNKEEVKLPSKIKKFKMIRDRNCDITPAYFILTHEDEDGNLETSFGHIEIYS